MKRISTHILDIVQGKPARDVPVRLEKQNAPGDWRLLTSTRTDQRWPVRSVAAGRRRICLQESIV